MWRFLLRPVLFRLDAEWVHYFAMNSFSLGLSIPFARSVLTGMTRSKDPHLQVDFLGLSFQNPVGLAAGFDKDARWFNQLAALGFSHIEVGTLTGQPQPGNPKKRLFRFSKDQALLNCMGFNNRGSEAAQRSMESAQAAGVKNRCVLGINIGLSKSVAVQIQSDAPSSVGNAVSEEDRLQMAIDDYLLSFRRMHPFADYFTINVSSPNTQGLRDLQHPNKIGDLIRSIRQVNEEISSEGQKPKPILVKLAPDLSESDLEKTLEVLVREKVDGLIATNTTISEKNLQTSPEQIQSKRCQCPTPGGGFSGRPLTEVSRRFVANVYSKTQGKLPIIGVGGIMSGEDAWNMLTAGASLIQVYTGFIYGGPFFIPSLNRYISRRMKQEGIASVSELTGSNVAGALNAGKS